MSDAAGAGMAEFGAVEWPPIPIRTERLLLRESEAGDRATFVELFSAPEVGLYTGGSQPPDQLERVMPEVPGHRPGAFVVERGESMLGLITLDRRDVGRRGYFRPEGREVELGYLSLPRAWGFGYATEACTAALKWFADAVPGEPVVLTTQSTNTRAMRLAVKLGFLEVERFEEFGAEQWMGAWSPSPPSS